MQGSSMHKTKRHNSNCTALWHYLDRIDDCLMLIKIPKHCHVLSLIGQTVRTSSTRHSAQANLCNKRSSRPCPGERRRKWLRSSRLRRISRERRERATLRIDLQPRHSVVHNRWPVRIEEDARVTRVVYTHTISSVPQRHSGQSKTYRSPGTFQLDWAFSPSRH